MWQCEIRAFQAEIWRLELCSLHEFVFSVPEQRIGFEHILKFKVLNCIDSPLATLDSKGWKYSSG